MESQQSNNRKPVWIAPWGYAEGWLIASGLLTVGLALQWVGGGLNPAALSWPVNLYIAIIFTALLIVAHVFRRNIPLLAWLGRVPAAICSITFITFLVLIMGIILQDDEIAASWIRRLGLSGMTRSWPFLFAVFFFLAALGLATMKRLIPFRGRNVGFLLNHLGLYIVILGGVIGAPDVERLLMELRSGELVWHASDQDGHVYEMPLAMELVRFEMEEFPPKAALVDADTLRIMPDTLRDLFEIQKGVHAPTGDWQVEVLQFHALSVPIGDRYEAIMDTGAVPSAYVRASHMESGETREGWITCGSFRYPHQMLALDDTLSLSMTVPRASAYRSSIVLYTLNREAETITIEVNKPYSVDGWKLYQYSYDDRFGRWSETSVIELVRDPWLPVVYIGIFMMVAGAVYLLCQGGPSRKQRMRGAGHAAV